MEQNHLVLYVMISTYALVFSIKILHHQIYVMLGWEHAFRVNVIYLVAMQDVLPLFLKKLLVLVFQILVPRIDAFVLTEARNICY